MLSSIRFIVSPSPLSQFCLSQFLSFSPSTSQAKHRSLLFFFFFFFFSLSLFFFFFFFFVLFSPFPPFSSYSPPSSSILSLSLLHNLPTHHVVEVVAILDAFSSPQNISYCVKPSKWSSRTIPCGSTLLKDLFQPTHRTAPHYRYFSNFGFTMDDAKKAGAHHQFSPRGSQSHHRSNTTKSRWVQFQPTSSDSESLRSFKSSVSWTMQSRILRIKGTCVHVKSPPRVGSFLNVVTGWSIPLL